MITTGIIRNINISSDQDHLNNLYSVEIGILKTPMSESKDATLDCTCCLPNGVYNAYKIGDIVYVGFVNNLLNQPVILGKIYKGLNEDEARSYLNIEDLKVQNSTNLPENTYIGNLSLLELKKNIVNVQNLITQFDIYTLLKNIVGFDPEKEQVLKNIKGEIK